MSNEVRANYGELSNEQLVIRIKAGEDVSGNMEQLYNQVRRFIHAVAWKYRDSGELEDQEQEGYLALYPAMARLGSLDSPVKGLDGGEDTTIGDMVASVEDMEGDTVERMQQEQLKAELWDYVDSLPGQQPAVIRMRFQDGMAMEAIGREYGTSGEAVRHIQAKALRELRKPRYSKRLRPFLPDADRIYSMAITGNGVGKFNRTWTSSTERAALNVIDWEERHRMHLELLEKVRKEVAKSQQAEA